MKVAIASTKYHEECHSTVQGKELIERLEKMEIETLEKLNFSLVLVIGNTAPYPSSGITVRRRHRP